VQRDHILMVLHHIVDVLDEDDVLIAHPEIFDERSVTARTENQSIILTAERLVVQSDSQCIGRFVLITVTGFDCNSRFSFDFRFDFSDNFLKQFPMILGYRKMHFRLFPKRTVTHRFLKMLLYRRGNMSFVFVKRKYSFWPSAEVEILRFQHKLDEMVNL